MKKRWGPVAVFKAKAVPSIGCGFTLVSKRRQNMSENFRTIYKILSILQKSMDYEVLDIQRLSADNLDVTEPKRRALLGMLLKNGYVEGFQGIQYIGDQTPNIEGLEGIRITLKGLEYLEENSLMQKAARLAKGIAEVL